MLQCRAVKLSPELAKAARLAKAIDTATAGRDEAIWECSQAGHSFRTIGAVTGLSHTQVARIVAKRK